MLCYGFQFLNENVNLNRKRELNFKNRLYKRTKTKQNKSQTTIILPEEFNTPPPFKLLKQRMLLLTLHYTS